MILTIILTIFFILIALYQCTTIEQLKTVKRNQLDILDLLEDIDLDYKTIEDELSNIKQSINNIAYTNRNQ